MVTAQVCTGDLLWGRRETGMQVATQGVYLDLVGRRDARPSCVLWLFRFDWETGRAYQLSPMVLFRFDWETGREHQYQLNRMVRNSCPGSSTVSDCMFNPGDVVQDSGVDANVSSQNTSICKS